MSASVHRHPLQRSSNRSLRGQLVSNKAIMRFAPNQIRLLSANGLSRVPHSRAKLCMSICATPRFISFQVAPLSEAEVTPNHQRLSCASFNFPPSSTNVQKSL